jgi:ribosomal protein S18 acetylase RimI-like enzyme
VFRPVDDKDVPVIASLMNRAYRGIGDVGWTSEESYLAGNRTTEDLLRADLAAKPAASLLKWQDDPAGGIIGCVWLEPVDEDIWYLGSLAIEPTKQNGGIGRTMLAAAENAAREHGAKRIRMTVINVRETLIAWYCRRGYAPTGETEPFPYGDDRFGTPLRDDLAFIFLEKAI